MAKYIERIKAADKAATEASDKWEEAVDSGRGYSREQAASERANTNVLRALVGKDPK